MIVLFIQMLVLFIQADVRIINTWVCGKDVLLYCKSVPVSLQNYKLKKLIKKLSGKIIFL